MPNSKFRWNLMCKKNFILKIFGENVKYINLRKIWMGSSGSNGFEVPGL